MKKIVVILLTLPSLAFAGELVHQFSSPAFSGNGYSTHVLTIDQLERQRDKENRDEAQAALDKAEREYKSTNLYKFQNNLESRIYAQLSKQIADSLYSVDDGDHSFSDTNNDGEINLADEWASSETPFGDVIKWMRFGDIIYVEIYDSNGDLASEFQTPVGDFAF